MIRQTAVEWLLEQIENKNGQDFAFYYFEFIEQAKQMERGQRITDYHAGYSDALCNHIRDAEGYVAQLEYINSNTNN